MSAGPAICRAFTHWACKTKPHKELRASHTYILRAAGILDSGLHIMPLPQSLSPTTLHKRMPITSEHLPYFFFFFPFIGLIAIWLNMLVYYLPHSHPVPVEGTREGYPQLTCSSLGPRTASDKQWVLNKYFFGGNMRRNKWKREGVPTVCWVWEYNSGGGDLAVLMRLMI